MRTLYEYIDMFGGVRIGDCDNKAVYLEFLNAVTKQFNWKEMLLEFDKPQRDFQDIYKGYSRISVSRFLNASAHLLVGGIKIIDIDSWQKIMDGLIEDLRVEYKKSGVEFLVLEMCSALLVLKDYLDKKKLNEYIKFLSTLDPYKLYDSTLKSRPIEELHNFCMYGICSEYLRGLLTGCDTSDFIERHWEIQKHKFNNDGMYMDPNNPMVYDITSRYRLALILHFGYSGPVAGEMIDVLEKGAETMLFLLSSDYKFPYGGRSNQYQFNEAMYASLCEFYCNMFLSKNKVAAGMFKACAGRCINHLEEWMKLEKPRHIKNLFPPESNYGTDSYGNYNRYMITAASFITGAIDFSREITKAYVPPCENGGFVNVTGSEFHKVFASCSGYSIEVDTNADNHYDATGLGRINRFNAPYGIALGMPFAKHPKYRLGDYTNTKGRSIGPFWLDGKKKVFLAENSCKSSVAIIKEDLDEVKFSVFYYIDEKGELIENYSISERGISVEFSCDFSPIGICLPVLDNPGDEKAVSDLKNRRLSVHYKGWSYIVSWNNDSNLNETGDLLYNRNGIYKEMHIECAQKEIQLKFIIEEAVNEQTTQKKWNRRKIQVET